jgi:hypothetical protein
MEKMQEQQDAIIEFMENDEETSQKSVDAMKERFEKQNNMIEVYRDNIERKLVDTSENINAITEEQIETSEQSAEASQNIINNSAQKKIEIEEKYAQEIEEIEQSLGETKETLQQQADDELFLHFETAQQKEIRLAKEKYDRLIGLAQGNAEDTKKLEQEKADVIKEINEREQKQAEKDAKAEIENEKKKAKILKDLKQQEALKTLQMGMDLAKEGTATYKAVASAETIMATFLGAQKAIAQVPFPFNFAQAGLVIATGIKNLAEISKTKVPGGGGGGASMPDTVTDVGGDMTGDVPSVTFGAVESDAPPIQAYVVESDVSGAQALQSELDLQSTL